ncbi:hypothetical protein B7494_g2467 [Chlorociboria aeruginascens]|nr:hypothetical protein B7494_g2467 [Chlorociboria aeruginascens]
MKTMLSSIDLIIECRDYRVPLTSRNPLFEESLAGRERLVVYTKRDLGSKGGGDKFKEEIIKSWHAPSPVLFCNHHSKQDVKNILSFTKDYALHQQSLTGSRIMIVGMPNVGKSSLLNALRMAGVHRKKAAFTGAQPGVTRKIASGVKIVDPDPETGVEGVYLVDTPGVFVPYVPDAESMLKLALVGSVKDTIIAPTLLVDYLLFHINRLGQERVYREYCEPTNEVGEFIDAVARKTGRLGKGGVPDTEATALWIVQRWRQGALGRFILDDVVDGGLEGKMRENVGVSLNQAKKLKKVAQVQRARSRGVETGVPQAEIPNQDHLNTTMTILRFEEVKFNERLRLLVGNKNHDCILNQKWWKVKLSLLALSSVDRLNVLNGMKEWKQPL